MCTYRLEAIKNTAQSNDMSTPPQDAKTESLGQNKFINGDTLVSLLI